MLKFEDNLASRVSGALQPMLGVQVTVTASNGLLATLYADDESTVLANPLTTDANGYFGFKAANGEYTLTFAGAQIETAKREIELYDADDDPPLTLAQAAVPTAASRFGYQAAGVGATPRTIENKLNEAVSIKDYGAQGDGVTDDTSAIQSAYDDNPTKAILHPAGTYLVTKTLTVPLTAVLIGSGKSSVLKQADGANLDAVLQSGIEGGARTNLRAFNLHIDGNKAGNPTGAGHGILLNRPRYSWIDLCEVVNTRGDGIRMETESGDFENYIRNCRVYGASGRNVAILGLGTDCHVRGGNYGYSVGSPIFLSTASSSVNDATIWGGNLSAYGVEVYGVSCQVRNNEIEGCTKDGILVSSYARHSFIEGNKLYANSFSSANSGLYGGCTVEAGAGPGTFVANRVYAALSSGAAYNQGYALKFSGAHDVWEIAANSMIWTGASANGTEASAAVVVGLLSTDKTDALWSKSRVSVGLSATLSGHGLNNWLPLPLSNEAEDGWGEWDAATYTFTPKESGRYQFSGIMTCDPDGIGSKMNFRIFRTSGTAAELARFGGATASDGEVMPVPMRTIETFLTAGSSYRIEFFLTGASTTVLAGSVFTQVQIKRVAQ